MALKRLENLSEARSLDVPSARLLSADHEEILAGHTTDIYFVKTLELLRASGRASTPVVAEIFCCREGVFAGTPDLLRLLGDAPLRVEALPEGSPFRPKEVLVRIEGSYEAFGMYETVILGMLASSSGWATAASLCVEAARGKPVLCFGARHVHPAVAPVMERAALIAGCSGASCILGARMAGRQPQGTIPHAAILIVGDTVELARLYDDYLPEGEARTILVDTFKDEAEEALRVARSLKGRLAGIRLDTPGERGGVTPSLVEEIRARLDLEGFPDVAIFVSGGLDPDRIALLSQVGADGFGVGSYIAHATPRDMTMDLKVIDGRPVAKRGRIPGRIANERLVLLRG